MGWSTDYPYAGMNLMVRYAELTTARVSVDHRRELNHWVVRLTDDALFKCPFTMAADVGTIGFTGEEGGKGDHERFRALPAVERSRALCNRFRDELGYTYSDPFSIHEKGEGSRTMY